MGFKLDKQKAEALFAELAKEYRIFAPKRFFRQGRYSDTDLVRYAEIKSFDEIEFAGKSDYPTKEVTGPIQQSLFFFTEDEYRESKYSEKKILVFAHPCDIHAQQIQAAIYAGNGGYTDYYYDRIHKLLKFVLMECPKDDDTCFCASLGTNRTDDYAMAVKVMDDGSVKFKVQDGELEAYFKDAAKEDFEPEFVESNTTKIVIPEIPNKEVLNKLKAHPMWEEYNKRCISCGACTLACSTCTCFSTKDIIYGDNPEVGERRRVSSSCEIADYTLVAGGGSYRKTAGERMRFKMLHKFHDYQVRFKDRQMCVGCGRCINRCPQLISITATLAKMYKAVDEIKSGKEVAK